MEETKTMNHINVQEEKKRGRQTDTEETHGDRQTKRERGAVNYSLFLFSFFFQMFVYPHRRNVTTSMVGLKKWSHMQKSHPKW